MALVATDLFIQMGPIPPTFIGTPQALADAMVQRMKIMSPGGTNFIFTGDTAPTSNVGPWLRGKQWWVWDPDTKQYVPLDLSASLTIPFFIGNSTPSGTSPTVWLQTTQDATTSAPTAFGMPIGWNVWNGTSWVPFVGIVTSGPTANRPTSPANLQQFYDTDISCLIWWERSQWRTVSGVPGDLKFVVFTTLAAALVANPGWDLFGRNTPGFLGRGLVAATQDAVGSNGSSTFAPVPGVPARHAFDTFGEANQIATSGSSGLVYPPSMAFWLLVKG
jgi:hypothetical protein